jgi:hypothetical protein
MTAVLARKRMWFCLTLLVLWGCEHAPPLEPEQVLEPKLSSIQEFVFDRSCAIPNCHAGSGAPHGLDLREGLARGNLVNVQSPVAGLTRVIPGDPDNSYLIHKLEGRPGISGAQMPFNADPLSPATIQIIADWIADGALDN